MRRPFKDKRPLGPFVVSQSPSEDPKKYTELDFDTEGKEVIGVSGTPMPGREKEDLHVIYVLAGDHIAFARDFKKRVQRDINARDIFEAPVRVKFLKSGTSAAKSFKEQAVVVEVPGENLAITESQLQRIERIIERPTKMGIDIEVKERIYEMEGDGRAKS
jgi:hypothetical protein